LLLAAVSAQATALNTSAPSDWALTHLHEASMPLERFPAADRALALSLLKPYLGPMFQGDSSEQVNQAMRSFRAERLTLAGSPALVVQPTGEELCGATGNCSFWIVDLHHRRVVLNAEGIQSFSTSSARPGAMPDIITSTHASASEQELTRWQFQGASYRREGCATVASAGDDGQPYSTPKITAHACDTEGN